jgi:hypothetical protein
MDSAVSPVARSHESARAFHNPLPTPQQASFLSTAAALPLACAACAAATAVYVVANDPGSGEGGLTPCPIRALTGRWCPGCGLTRATHHLFRGNILQALSFNLFVPVALAALVALWFIWFRVATGRGVPARVMALRVSTYVAAGAVLAVFTVARNFEDVGVLRGG